MKSRIFAYNSTGTTFHNFKIIGYLSYNRIGDGAPEIDTVLGNTDGLYLWGGPDEDIRHIIGIPVHEGNQPTPVPGKTAFLGFYGSGKTDLAFINLVNWKSGEKFTTVSSAKKWLNLQGYWSSYGRWFDWEVDGGGNQSLGIDYTGQTWAWGRNNYGQLGNNTIIDQYTPVSISGSTKTFCSIKTGYYHSLGINSLNLSIEDSNIWAWGRNNYGQLGVNSVVNYCTPVSVLGVDKTFCSITTGYYNSLGIDNAGQVWGWGRNNYGQLGVNSVVDYCTPVSIVGTTKTFCSINSGDYHSLGIDYTGQVWAWGNNENGQLGVYYNTITPIMINI